jgi:hypothetical protein
VNQTWVVGALLEDDADKSQAAHLERVMAEAGHESVVITPIGDGHLRVSFHVQASTAEQAEHRAVEVLKRCSRVAGVEPHDVHAVAR